MTTITQQITVTCDDMADAAYIHLDGSEWASLSYHSLSLPDIRLDFDAEGRLIGIELLSMDLLHPALRPEEMI